MQPKEMFEAFMELYPNAKDCALHLIHDVDKSNPKPIFHLSDTGYEKIKEYEDK